MDKNLSNPEADFTLEFEKESVNENALVCLNRLSDLCFILARVEIEVDEE